jgi:hypothetical protein
VSTNCARNLFHNYVQTIQECKASDIASEPSHLGIPSGGDKKYSNNLYDSKMKILKKVNMISFPRISCLIK